MDELKYDIINIHNELQYIIQKIKKYKEIIIKKKFKNNNLKKFLKKIFSNKNIDYEKYQEYFYEDYDLEIMNPTIYIETIDVILNSNKIDVLQSKFSILKIILSLYQNNIKNYFDKIISIKICNMKLEYIINNITYSNNITYNNITYNNITYNYINNNTNNKNNINNKCKYCNKRYDKKNSLLSHQYRKHKK
jgi:hypothetical protein